MHHVSQQNVSDVKLSATGEELVVLTPWAYGSSEMIPPERIPAHPVSVAAIKPSANGMSSSQCMCGPFTLPLVASVLLAKS